jgi:cysteine desulfurase
MTRIYLDYNATTPLRPQARDAMLRVLDGEFGNPSSVHWAGAAARNRVAEARAQVAELVGVAPETLVFTSSATEANNTILRSIGVRGGRARGGHIVTCRTEHPSVLEASEGLRDEGFRVTVLPVDSDGRVEPERFAASLTEGTLLASVMWVNNETGAIQPIAELAALARQKGVLFHSDAVQALGKLPVDLASVPVDYASFSAHKLGGPKGVGALYARAGVRFSPLMRGGSQERRRRPGTENVPGIVGFGAACDAAGADLEAQTRSLGELRDRLWREIEAKIPAAHANGLSPHRVSNTLNVSFPGAESDALVAAMDLEGVAVATGAACAAGSTEPSHVLLAMGLTPEVSNSAIRISLGFDTQSADIDRFLSVLPGVVERARRAA